MGPSFCELMSLIRERDAEAKKERAELEVRLESQRRETEAKLESQRRETEARLESQRRETERQRQQFEELHLEAERQKHREEVKQIKARAVQWKLQERLHAEQVAILQRRLEALHSAKLLTVSNCNESTTSRVSM